MVNRTVFLYTPAGIQGSDKKKKDELLCPFRDCSDKCRMCITLAGIFMRNK